MISYSLLHQALSDAGEPGGRADELAKRIINYHFNKTLWKSPQEQMADPVLLLSAAMILARWLGSQSELTIKTNQGGQGLLIQFRDHGLLISEAWASKNDTDQELAACLIKLAGNLTHG